MTTNETAQQTPIWLTTLPSVMAIVGSFLLLLISNRMQSNRERKAAERTRLFKALETISELATDCGSECVSALFKALEGDTFVAEQKSVNRLDALAVIHFPRMLAGPLTSFRGTYRTVRAEAILVAKLQSEKNDFKASRNTIDPSVESRLDDLLETRTKAMMDAYKAWEQASHVLFVRVEAIAKTLHDAKRATK